MWLFTVVQKSKSYETFTTYLHTVWNSATVKMDILLVNAIVKINERNI